MIKVYTDGACKGNPGQGGWGALILENDSSREIYGGENNTTNNRMELMAVIKALESLKEQKDIIVYTDSTYVQKGISEWIINWKRNGWKSSNKKTVKNKDLWVELDNLNDSMSVKWEWIKGHAGHSGNERADYLANLGVNSSSG
jgi:ribonuclease HI